MKRITSFLLAIVLFAGFVLTGIPAVYAASEMKASDDVIEIIKKIEGFASKPYWDYGQYTVGYGTRCPDDMLEEYQANGITKEAADVLLRNYLSSTENAINKKFIDKYGLTLTQGQFDALVSFTYNCGTRWMSDTTSTFFKAVKNGATGSELIHAFTLWCKAGGEILTGLVKRRQSEANMFLNGEYSRTPPDNFCYVYLDPNGGSVSYTIQGYEASEGVKPKYTPTYEGHEFLGWYTAKTGGSKVTKLTEKLSTTTLYARWEGVEDTEETTKLNVTVTVTSNDVNLRKGPGTNYGKAGQVNKGDKLTITETASGSGYLWGKAGDVWVALKYTDYDAVIQEQETTVPETTVPETTVPETTEPAETKLTGVVKVDGRLSVRKGPGTDYARVDYLSNGTQVTILEQKKVGNTTWGRISSGWISMDYVVLDQAQTEPTIPETTVPETTVPETTVPETTVPETTVPETTVPETTVPETTEPETTVPETTVPAETKLTGVVKVSGRLSVRKGPGTGYARVAYLSNGSKVTILEQKKVGSTTWGRISSGWISMDYVVLDQTQTEPTTPEAAEPENTVPVKTKITGKVKASGGLAVRKGPGTNYAIRKYLSNGTAVTINETKVVKSVTWGKISSGWISMNHVVLDSDTTDTKTVKTVIASSLRIRKSASTSAAIVGCYYKGDKVTILQTKKVGNTNWGRTSKGWISMDYVK